MIYNNPYILSDQVSGIKKKNMEKEGNLTKKST